MPTHHPYTAFHSVPTVVPAENFSAEADATALEVAIRTCDENTIVKILGNRNITQRLAIASTFEDLYCKELVAELKSELFHHFEDLVVALMMPLPELYARELHKAVHGPGTDELAIVEVLMSLSNYGIIDVSTVYMNEYGKSLEQDLKDDTSGEFRNLLVRLCSGTRDESDIVNEEVVRDDAIALAHAGSSVWSKEESVFSSVLATRSFPHLRLVFRVFQKMVGRDLESYVDHEFSGDLRKGYLSIVRIVSKRTAFFARRLHDAMKGLGTNDRTLIRIIVSRSEIDLGDIKHEYLALYGKTLESRVASDTSGHYRKLLLEILATPNTSITTPNI